MKTYTVLIKTPDYIDYADPVTDEPLIVFYMTDSTPTKAARNAQDAALRMFAVLEDPDLPDLVLDMEIDDFKVVRIFAGSMEGSIALQIDF